MLFTDDCITVIFSKASKEDWRTIQDTLHKYKKASGQVLNRQKISILFSSKEAGSILCGDYGRYLGLPTMVGRAKYQAF